MQSQRPQLYNLKSCKFSPSFFSALTFFNNKSCIDVPLGRGFLIIPNLFQKIRKSLLNIILFALNNTISLYINISFYLSILQHCVKSVRIRSYSGPYFPKFGLNTERCTASLGIQCKCGKYGPEQLRIWTHFMQYKIHSETSMLEYFFNKIAGVQSLASVFFQEICKFFLALIWKTLSSDCFCNLSL